MTQKQKKIAIIILLPVLIVSGLLRHVPIIPTWELKATFHSPIIACVDDGYSWEKIIPHNIVTSIVKTIDSGSSIPQYLAFLAYTALIVLANRRKSHIEYCGKKMVRAIMLQWRPD